MYLIILFLLTRPILDLDFGLSGNESHHKVKFYENKKVGFVFGLLKLGDDYNIPVTRSNESGGLLKKKNGVILGVILTKSNYLQ